MKLSIGSKMGLGVLICIVALAYLLTGDGDVGGGGYRAPDVVANQDEPIAQFNRAKYADNLKITDAGRKVVKIEKGLSDFAIRLETSRRWQAQSEKTRLKSARALWKAWAELFPPPLRYKARIVIVDDKGTKIGGSRMLNTSEIWVRKD